MTLSGFDMVFYTMAFLVPGFVMHSTMAQFRPRSAEQAELTLLRFLTYSAVNYAIWSWLVYLIYTTGYYQTHSVRTAIAWAVVILFSPLAVGGIWGFFSGKEIGRRIMRRVGINSVHPIPTGWDYKFSKMVGPRWVLVTLKDGNYVGGLFGSKSFASSEPGERDLYIQEVFDVFDDKPWQRRENTDGILIHGGQIRHIEFLE